MVSEFAMITAEVGGQGRGWCRRTKSLRSRMRSNMGSRARLRTLAEGVEKIILIRKSLKSGEHSIHTSGGGKLPDFFEQETNVLINPVVQAEQAAHLPHKHGGLLIRGQVRDMKAWYLWKGLRVCSWVRCSLRDS